MSNIKLKHIRGCTWVKLLQQLENINTCTLDRSLIDAQVVISHLQTISWATA